MDLIRESFQRLFPEKEFCYQTEMGYNRRLASFNANIKLEYYIININLNLRWKNIDDEIKIGLIQHLLLKIFRKKNITTLNIELYHNFIKNIPLLTPKTRNDPLLEKSFLRINNSYFNNELEQPNLAWGQQAFRKLASYNFHNDLVTVSTIFRDCRQEVLDYLMYHELLHKHHQFQQRNGRSRFHTPEFRKAEKAFPGQERIEKEINQIIRSKKKSGRKSFWWCF